MTKFFSQPSKLTPRNRKAVSASPSAISTNVPPEVVESSSTTNNLNDAPITKPIEPVIAVLPVPAVWPEFHPYTEKVPGTAIQIEMVPIPGGKMVLGSPNDEPGRENTDLPKKEVTIKPFFMAKFEISWEQLIPYVHVDSSQIDRILKNGEGLIDKDGIIHPASKDGWLYRGRGEKEYPAIGMSYYLAETYCKWLNGKTGKMYRLPTEQEWEYACRAGSSQAFFWGKNPSRAGEFSWFKGNSEGTTHPVGKLKPNSFGLYDITGNVMEWCAKENAQQPGVVRGGAWSEPVERLRSASRVFEKADWSEFGQQSPKGIGIWWLATADFVGFRIVCSLSEQKNEAAMALFKKTGCAGCHGVDGKPTKIGIKMGARDYTDPAVKASLNDESMLNAIQFGVVSNGKTVMQGVSNKLTAAEINILIELMKAF
jgi:formylglycine-generating enzyme required for sulfatase activity/cytochrome c553